MSSYQNANGHSSKPRAKVVKPMLRKLTQSEKNSIDLDRPAEDQDGLGIYDFGAGRSVHDVSFSHSRRGYHNYNHNRSTSGTSQFSTATSGSGNRTGSFVHPFQQTPRPYTPPITSSPSYQNSLRESEHSFSNSPALTEDEDQLRQHPLRNASSLSNNHGTPSLQGSITPNLVGAPALRIQTKQPSSSRLARASHTSLSSTLILSPDVTSPSETMSPASVIRSSMDRGFRIRSRSDGNSYPRTETVQEARRRWNEREQEKDEIAAREEIKALEKRNKKEARQFEKGQRRSSASDRARSKRSKSDITLQEKGGVIGYDYHSASVQTPPLTSEGFEAERRPTTLSNTKKKTHSAWTTLMMWLRTRFMRMNKKTDRS